METSAEPEADDDDDDGGGGHARTAKLRRRAGGAEASLVSTWRDGSAGAADVDLLSAPLIPMGGDGGGGRAAGGKRRRAEAEPPSSRPSNADDADAADVKFDSDGKLVGLDGEA